MANKDEEMERERKEKNQGGWMENDGKKTKR